MRRSVLLVTAIGGLGVGALAGCASPPRPRVMQDVVTIRSSPGSTQAKRSAPQEYAEAERLRHRAEKAYLAGDIATAQLLSEQALAAYDRTMALARLVSAERRYRDADQRLTNTQKELESIEQQSQALAVEARDLEMQAKVARDAEPLRPSEGATPDREQARRLAARSLASRARLLCVSAGLLDPKSTALQTLESVKALEASTNKGSAGTLIDEARRLESHCLTELTSIRRPVATRRPTGPSTDALLSDLSQSGGFFAFRDDRGIVVVLRDVFARDLLSPSAQTAIVKLGEIAREHPDYPVLLVLHGTGPSVSSRAAAALEQALTQAGAARVTTETVAESQPVVDPKLPRAQARNQRVEIIFVSPRS